MTFGHDVPDNDPVAARLRAALNAEASMVNPSNDSLEAIRDRTRAQDGRWWRGNVVTGVAAALVMLLVIGGGAALLLRDGDDGSAVIAGPGTSSTDPGETGGPTEAPTADATVSPTAPDGHGPSVYNPWVYYVLDDPAAGPRLYRERHAVEDSSEIAALPGAAQGVWISVLGMLAQAPHDPDYTSLWPAGTEVADVSFNTSWGNVVTVDLTDFPAVGAGFEEIAVQQLVYTVTANDPSIKKVKLLVNGETPPSGHQEWSEPVGRAQAVDVQGLIWLLEPGEDSEAQSPVEIVGYGTAFEGTVSWEVRKAGTDEVVAEGFTQAGSMGEFADFQDTVELEPGTYEIRAFESSAEDGRPIHVDDKTFTVGE